MAIEDKIKEALSTYITTQLGEIKEIWDDLDREEQLEIADWVKENLKIKEETSDHE